MTQPLATGIPHSARRLAVAALVTAAVLTAVFGATGCAGTTADTDTARTTVAQRPAPPIDAKVPPGLKTAVFGLG